MKSPILSAMACAVSLAALTAGGTAVRAQAVAPVGASAVAVSLAQVEKEIRGVRDTEARGQALAELVGALASAGDLARARKAATWIETTEWKGQALRAIALALAPADLSAALAQAQTIEDDDVRCAALTDIALNRYQSGDRGAALRILGQAAQTAQAGVNAYLGAGRTRMLFLQAALGEAGAALQSAEHLVEPDVRAVALADIAAGLAEAGDVTGAESALARAMDLVHAMDRGRLPALRSLAQALAALGRRDEAVALAGEIDDPRLRAEAWMGIASEGRSLEKAGALRQVIAILDQSPGEYRFGVLVGLVAALERAGMSGVGDQLLERASHWVAGVDDAPRRVRAMCALIRASSSVRGIDRQGR